MAESTVWLELPEAAVATEIRIGRGLHGRLAHLIAERTVAPAYAVVADANVAPLHGDPLCDALSEHGDCRLHVFPPGETSKTPERWMALVEAFGESGLGRDGCVVAVGGGVTGDLAGFAAATYARGVCLVQVPTSLLAMIDASLGGKTGVDLRAGKNLAGAFHHPALVAIDPDVLSTLPTDELRTGLAEAVKHGAIADADYLTELEGAAAGILALDPGPIERVVEGSVRIKTEVVRRDAREAGERAVLNFGHTIAHGIERATAYAVPHGQAVAMGMVAEAVIGENAGLTRQGTADRLRRVLKAFGLPVTLPRHVEPAAVVEAARSDKKAREGRVRYALIAEPGLPARAPDGGWTHPVGEADATTAVVSLATGPAVEDQV